MQIAVIDCGTNTFNLLIVSVHLSSYNVIFTTKIPVKLGEGGINSNTITPEAFKRGVEAIDKLNTYIISHKVNKTVAFATSAIRDAENGKEFTKNIFDKTGIVITIIDGDKEAELIYKGNKLAVNLMHTPSLIMDIGGGSTEFIIGNKDEVFWKKSFQLGAARLLAKFAPSNPITQNEIISFNEYLNKELSELKSAIEKFKPLELIGSSGAFDSVIELIHGQLGGEPLSKTKTEFEINCDDYFKIHEMVIKSTIEERRIMKGLVEMRVDMMVISCLLIKHAIDSGGLTKFRVSTYSLKEGALSEIMNSNQI